VNAAVINIMSMAFTDTVGKNFKTHKVITYVFFQSIPIPVSMIPMV
jgi:hypothetical protein